MRKIVLSGTAPRPSLRRPVPRIFPTRKRHTYKPRVPTLGAGHAITGARAARGSSPGALLSRAQELCCEVFLVEHQDAMPHVLSRRRTIARPIVREESVAGVTVHPKFVGFPMLIEFFLQTGSMRR